VMSPLPTPLTCPLQILFMTSSPWSVRPAVSKEKKAIPGLTSRLMKRWSCSIKLFKSLTCLRLTASASPPLALRKAIAEGLAAFVSPFITPGADVGGSGSAAAVGWATYSWIERAPEAEPAVACSALTKNRLAAEASRVGLKRNARGFPCQSTARDRDLQVVRTLRDVSSTFQESVVAFK
jgi:hypothetical protein